MKPPKCEAPAGGRARNAEGALARSGGATRTPLTLPSARPGSLTAPPPRDSPGPAPAGSPPEDRKVGLEAARGWVCLIMLSCLGFGGGLATHFFLRQGGTSPGGR